MLATGGTVVAAIGFLKERNIKNIKYVCLIAAPEGVRNMHNHYPDIPIFCAGLDEALDENAYILPRSRRCR